MMAEKKSAKKIRQFSRKILIRHKSSYMCITNEFRLYGCKNTFLRRLHACCLLSLFIVYWACFILLGYCLYVRFVWFDKKRSILKEFYNQPEMIYGFISL